MRNDVLEYKGYYAKIEFDATTHTLFGKIEGIQDLVTFESTSPTEIDAEFRAAVDDYLAFCEEVGKAPEKQYRGKFNVRIEPALKKQHVHKTLEERVKAYGGKLSVTEYDWGAPVGKEVL